MSSLETSIFNGLSWNVYKCLHVQFLPGTELCLRHQPLHPNSWKEVEKAGEEVPGGTAQKQHLKVSTQT